jgi:hypothetical protein
MNSSRDIVFKVGLGLQLVLIPVAFLWRFSQEANYYNWVIALSFMAITALFLWPQAIQVRTDRLKAIQWQFGLVAVLLALSWAAYVYFHHYVSTHTIAAIYSVNWEAFFGRRWVMWLGPGISISTALLMTALCIIFPFANLYRYRLDKRRIKGIKKEDLFI